MRDLVREICSLEDDEQLYLKFYNIEMFRGITTGYIRVVGFSAPSPAICIGFIEKIKGEPFPPAIGANKLLKSLINFPDFFERV